MSGAMSSGTGSRGLAVYVGSPGSGKTTLAEQHARQLAAARGVGAFCIDSTGSAGLERWEEFEDLGGALKAVWKENRLARYSPRDEDELRGILRAARDPGRLVVLLDELALWPPRMRELDALCRVWRHVDTDVLLTAQHLSGDIAQGLRACSPRVFAFHTAPSTTLDVLEKGFRLPGQQLQTLGRGEYLLHDPLTFEPATT
jgi:RecA/RadA recombinase